MGTGICNTALCTCSFGAAPAALNILPTNMVNSSKQPAATIMDNIPMTNVGPFGMCSSMGNPAVASATASASGVLTPQSCTPTCPGPWIPTQFTVMIKNNPALTTGGQLVCAFGGMISITMPGQFTVSMG